MLENLPKDGREERVQRLLSDAASEGERTATERTLGAYWDAEADAFRLKAELLEPGNTHRKILSQVFSIWDPLCLIIPINIRAKMFLQKLWIENLHRQKGERIGWDDLISDEKLGECNHWFHETKQLSQIVIPRPFHARPELPISSTLWFFVMPAKGLTELVRTLFWIWRQND